MAIITDLHLDFDYTEGMSNDCGKPLCCRSDSGPPTSNAESSGKWGDFKCDIPVWTLENMLDYIREEVKPDGVMWLGDSIPHNVETLTEETNIEIMKNVT